MFDSVRPHRRQPTRFPRPWDSPGKNTEVGCHFLLQCMKVKSESEVAQSCPTPVTPWTAAFQAPPSMGFSRQKYWSGVPLPSPAHSVSNPDSLLNPPHLESSYSGQSENLLWAGSELSNGRWCWREGTEEARKQCPRETTVLGEGLCSGKLSTTWSIFLRLDWP